MKRTLHTLIEKLAPHLMGMHGQQRLSILLYHRILPSSDYMRPGEPLADDFDWQMQLLREHFNPISLSEALDGLASGTLPENSVCVTFDDGYADNVSIALPILEKWRIPATVFVATGLLNGGRMWNDSVLESLRAYPGDRIDLDEIGLGAFSLVSETPRRDAAHTILNKIKHWAPGRRDQAVAYIEELCGADDSQLMLSEGGVSELAERGVELGCHTVDHPILANLAEEKAFSQIEESKKTIERITEKPCRYFAYPNGKPGKDFTAVHQEMVKQLGFRAALATTWGVADANSDLWQLPRFTPWDKTAGKFHLRLLANCRRPV